MTEQFVILCCENIRPEVDAVLATGAMPRAAARSFPAHCGRIPSFRETIREQFAELESAGDAVCLCGCGCANFPDISEDVKSRPPLALMESGAALFLPEALSDEFRRCGAGLVLPGWLLGWKQNREQDGLDRSTAREMFSEPVSAIVLLDTGLRPGIDPVLAEFAEFCGLPARTFPVGTGHLRFRLAALYHAWESRQVAAACRESVKAAEKRAADYPMIADLTERLTGIHNEQEAILQVLDFIVRIFSPEKTGFLPVYAAGTGDVLSIPADAYPDKSHFQQAIGPGHRYRISGKGDSFLYQVKYHDDLIGILSVDGISRPGSPDDHISITHLISQVATLSITVARTSEDLMLAMKAREMQIAERIQAELALRESEEQQQKQKKDLAFKVRELNCLYEIGRLVETADTTDSLLQSIADILPSAGQYPDLTCARVVIDGREFLSRAFTGTSLMGEARIIIHGKGRGKIGIFFGGDGSGGSQPVPSGETDLLSAIAERLGRILERKEMEEALRESEVKYRTLVESSFDGIAIHQNGRLVYVNQTAARLLGSGNPGEFIGKPAIDIVAPAYREQVEGRIRQSPGTALDLMREQFLRLDGIPIDVDVTTAPSIWEGKPAAYVTFRDITAQVHAENALRESEGKIRLLLNSAAEGIYGIDLNGNCTFCNNACLSLLGYQHPDDLLGKNMHWQIHGKHADGSVFPVEECRIFQAFRKSEGTHADDEVLWRADGTSFPAEYWSYPQRDKGTVIGAVVTFLNITDRKRMEEALRESEEKYRTIINEMQDIFYRTDNTGKITMLSPSAAKLAGYDSPDQLIGQDVTIVYANPADRDKLLAAMQESGAVYAFPIDLKVRDGSTRHVTTSSHFYRSPQGTIAGVEGVIHDVTSLRKVEDALRESEERYRTIIENIQDVYFRIDRDNLIEMVSPSGAPMFGFASAAEMLKKPIGSLWSHPEQRPLLLDAMREQGGAVQDWETEFVKTDGTVFWGAITAHLRTDRQGGFLGTEGIIRDISERRKMEAALKSTLTKLNMLSSITRHDILNQITGLRTFLELSKEDLKGTKHENFIEKEDQAAEAIQRQIEFTKFYQDIGVNAPKWQDAGAVIKEAAHQISLPAIDLQINVSGVEIFADPLIVKVFFNLIENSLRHGERVTQVSFSSRKSVEGLIITYRDNGAGISAEDKKKLFQRGFGKHTGLGLFLSREILAITGITITENGEPQKGAQFEITVPYGAFRILP